MTIHQSKGLEFPVVILPNLGRKFNRQDSAGSILADRRSYLALHAVDEPRQVQYPSMASVVLRDTIDAQSTAEEIRILYVALTRAKEHLVLIGSVPPKAIDTAAARWAGHTGPLPVQTVRGGQFSLDWLLPIASRAGQDIFDVRAVRGRRGFSHRLIWRRPAIKERRLGCICVAEAAQVRRR